MDQPGLIYTRGEPSLFCLVSSKMWCKSPIILMQVIGIIYHSASNPVNMGLRCCTKCYTNPGSLWIVAIMATHVLELDLGWMLPGLMNCTFCFTMWTSRYMCIDYLGKVSTRMQCWTKTSQWKECDALVNVLLGNSEPGQLCGPYFNIYHLTEHTYIPSWQQHPPMKVFSFIRIMSCYIAWIV